jgi:hypothetical protein
MKMVTKSTAAKGAKPTLPPTEKEAKKAGLKKLSWKKRHPSPGGAKAMATRASPPYVYGVGPDGRIMICYPDRNGAYTKCYYK